MRALLALLSVLAVLALIAPSRATPFRPGDDAQVLEQLPDGADPAWRAARRLRAALAKTPADAVLAADVARRYLDLAASRLDPRFMDYARNTLAPWWDKSGSPAPISLLQAEWHQRMRDYAGARRALDRVLLQDPADGQALPMRAAVDAASGREEDARRDCARLSAKTSALVLATCQAQALGMTAEMPRIYARLRAELDHPSSSTRAVRARAQVLAAELADRVGDGDGARRLLARAVAENPGDATVTLAWADLLLAQDRPEAVQSLLRDQTRSDALLLRYVLALKRLGSADFAVEADTLRARISAARGRGSLLLAEDARFTLEVLDQPVQALSLAKANWAAEKTPQALRLMAAAAAASRDSTTLTGVAEWVAAHGTVDRRLPDPSTAPLRHPVPPQAAALRP